MNPYNVMMNFKILDVFLIIIFIVLQFLNFSQQLIKPCARHHVEIEGKQDTVLELAFESH